MFVRYLKIPRYNFLIDTKGSNWLTVHLFVNMFEDISAVFLTPHKTYFSFYADEVQ